MKIKNTSMRELVAYENAANVVRKNYEDMMVMYRGVDYNNMNENEALEYTEFSQKLSRINSIRLNLLKEMEARLLDIE